MSRVSRGTSSTHVRHVDRAAKLSKACPKGHRLAGQPVTDRQAYASVKSLKSQDFIGHIAFLARDAGRRERSMARVAAKVELNERQTKELQQIANSHKAEYRLARRQE